MLNDRQMDYLLQIKATVPPLAERTVRVMLTALRWLPEEIEHGIAFLKKPPEPLYPSPQAQPPEPAELLPKPPPAWTPPKTIVIKQNPFPIGAPHLGPSSKPLKKKDHRALRAGAIAGLIVFFAGLFLFVVYLR